MRRREILKGVFTTATMGAAGLACPAIAQAEARTLHFVPQANLANPDPIWTTATVAINHGYMVFDTLYGIDAAVQSHPQMCAGHEISDDKLTWTFTLREGLLFHDNERVRAVDCTTSISRWATKDPFGQQLVSLTEEMKALDDTRFSIRLKKPFSQMLYALGTAQLFHDARAHGEDAASEQIKEYVGSGPFRFLKEEWVSGARAAWAKFEIYAAPGAAPYYFGRQGSECRPSGMARTARPRHGSGRTADRRGGLGGAAADRPAANAQAVPRDRGEGL